MIKMNEKEKKERHELALKQPDGKLYQQDKKKFVNLLSKNLQKLANTKETSFLITFARFSECIDEAMNDLHLCW